MQRAHSLCDSGRSRWDISHGQSAESHALTTVKKALALNIYLYILYISWIHPF